MAENNSVDDIHLEKHIRTLVFGEKGNIVHNDSAVASQSIGIKLFTPRNLSIKRYYLGTGPTTVFSCQILYFRNRLDVSSYVPAGA